MENMVNMVNIDDFGAVGNGVADDSEAFKKAVVHLKKVKGGTIYIPAKTYAIKKSIVIDHPGIYIQGVSPVYSIISLLDGFEGSGAIVYTQIKEFSELSSGVGIIGGLRIHCNNQLTNGIYGLRMYDQVLFQNVMIRKVHRDYSGFHFTQDAALGNQYLGQTLLLENCIAERFGSEASNPDSNGIYYFERYQEVNLVGCKAFSTIGTQLSQGTAFFLKDCRGITFTGCSAAFAENAIVTAATNRSVSGISVYGQTNELITGYALKIISENGFKSSEFTFLPIRSQSGSGDYKLVNLDLSTIYSLNRKVSLDASSYQNTIYSSSAKDVLFEGRGNSIIGLANYNSLGVSIHDSLTISGQDTFGTNPMINLVGKNQATKSRVVLQKNGNLDFMSDEGGNYKNLLSLLNDNKSNGTSLVLTYSLDGVDFKTGRVELGPPDSAGQGYRQLRILN